LDQRLHLVGARAGVPHVGVLGDEAEEHLLPRAADHEGRVRLLHRLGEADGVGHRVVPAVERGARLGQHAADDLEGLPEGLQAAGNSLEVDAEVTVLALEPSGAEAQVEAAPAHVVQGRRHLGGDARMAVGVAAHHGADARPPGGLRERGERRPALEARPLGIDEDRVEVIEVPERVVAPGVGLLPEREELRPREALLPGLDAEADRMGGHAASYTDSTRGGKRWSRRRVRRLELAAGLALLVLTAPGARAAELRLGRDDRILVLAPHPDDEALACGGLVQRARKMRLPVHVVFLTYGDSNEWSFAVYRKHPVVVPRAVRAMG